MKPLIESLTGLIVFLFLWCGLAYSQDIYKWTDSEGNKNYTTGYDRIPLQYRDQMAIPSDRIRDRQDFDISHNSEGSTVQLKTGFVIPTEEELRLFFAKYIERYAQKDLDGFLALFSPKAVQNQRDGFDEIRKIYSDFFNESKDLRFHAEDMRIEIYQNAVSATARYEVDQILKRGGKKKVWKGYIRWILSRENGALRIRYLDFSN